MPILGTAAIVLPIAAVISCGSQDKFSKTYTFEAIDWSKINYTEATITKWIDGDTFTCTSPDEKDPYNVRVEYIDTPESHVKIDDKFVDTEGAELEAALEAYHFGMNEIPSGTKVRLALEPGLTYNRKIASVFYGQNFEKSYEVNILRKGLAMPMINSSGLRGLMQSDSEILHYLAVPLADGYNYAIENKLGLFKTASNSSDILKIHGVTDVSAVTVGKPRNIYSYADVDFWK